MRRPGVRETHRLGEDAQAGRAGDEHLGGLAVHHRGLDLAGEGGGGGEDDVLETLGLAVGLGDEQVAGGAALHADPAPMKVGGGADGAFQAHDGHLGGLHVRLGEAHLAGALGGDGEAAGGDVGLAGGDGGDDGVEGHVLRFERAAKALGHDGAQRRVDAVDPIPHAILIRREGGLADHAQRLLALLPAAGGEKREGQEARHAEQGAQAFAERCLHAHGVNNAWGRG